TCFYQQRRCGFGQPAASSPCCLAADRFSSQRGSENTGQVSIWSPCQGLRLHALVSGRRSIHRRACKRQCQAGEASQGDYSQMRSRMVSRTRGKVKMNILPAALCLLFLLPSEARLQSRKPMTIAELVTYNGADRENILYNGAKTEGKITWYTSLAGE